MIASIWEPGTSLLRRRRSGAVLAIAATVIVAVTVVGCSTHTSGTGASSTTGSPSSTTGTASPGPGNSASPSATANARFVGQWHVHDATLNITPTTATRVASLGMGPCTQDPQVACSENNALAVTSGNDTQITLTVTAVSYVLHSGQTTSVSPTTGPSTAVGDSILLVWQAPGFLKQAVLKGFPGLQGGNPYWCGAGISQSDQQKCGA